jgi:hypothetical protein
MKKFIGVSVFIITCILLFTASETYHSKIEYHNNNRKQIFEYWLTSINSKEYKKLVDISYQNGDAVAVRFENGGKMVTVDNNELDTCIRALKRAKNTKRYDDDQLFFLIIDEAPDLSIDEKNFLVTFLQISLLKDLEAGGPVFQAYTISPYCIPQEFNPYVIPKQ